MPTQRFSQSGSSQSGAGGVPDAFDRICGRIFSTARPRIGWGRATCEEIGEFVNRIGDAHSAIVIGIGAVIAHGGSSGQEQVGQKENCIRDFQATIVVGISADEKLRGEEVALIGDTILVEVESFPTRDFADIERPIPIAVRGMFTDIGDSIQVAIDVVFVSADIEHRATGEHVLKAWLSIEGDQNRQRDQLTLVDEEATG